VVCDLAPALKHVLEELLADEFHNTAQYANSRIEADHGRLKVRLRSMRGLKSNRTAPVIIRGHAFIQNIRRGHHELGAEVHPQLRLATAFDELSRTI
jgi:IS6 family transposase